MTTLTLDEFRTKAATFLEANARRRGTEADDTETADAVSVAKAFQRKLADAGLAGLTYPVEYGGQGLDKSYQEVFGQEAAGYVLPVAPLGISHGMCLPVMSQFAPTELKERHIAKMISGEEIFAQMFSEPGAGSDVASLQTRAVRDGDEWVINGQKVWTSGAHYCDYGIALCRTDPDLPKHQGLSMFLLDLKAPGVDIRPLRQINGNTDFNEIFLTDVRVPAAWILGDLNRGWDVAVAMLMFERVAIGAGGAGGMAGSGYRLAAGLARAKGVHTEPVVRDALAQLYIDEQILKFVGQRIRAAVQGGKIPGPEGSIAKLASAKLAVRTASIAMQLAGPAGLAWDPVDDEGDRFALGVVSAPGLGIAGGTNEVQRNIIGERVLGLPGDVRVDKGIPFNDVLVGTQARSEG
jgi:alkylation response protein AidB-like acyl-CoA dehydrogenase